MKYMYFIKGNFSKPKNSIKKISSDVGIDLKADLISSASVVDRGFPMPFFHMNIKQSPICNKKRKHTEKRQKKEELFEFFFMTCYLLIVKCINNYPLQVLAEHFVCPKCL
jgi:hypothetical protein